MRSNHPFVLSLISIALFGCKARGTVTIPSFGDSSQIAGAPQPNDFALKQLEGVYSAKTSPFGDLATFHATRHTLSIFNDRQGGYTVLTPGCLENGSRLVFEGYWRHAVTTDTGLIRIEADRATAGAVCSGQQITKRASFSGFTSTGEAKLDDSASFQFDSPLAPMTQFTVAAHHGACRTIDECGASENTLESIALVQPFGANIVEIDVRLTKDGVPILFHDETWAPRLVDGPLCHGAVDDFTLQQARASCRNYYGEAIPTLDEALAFVVDHTDLRAVWIDMKLPKALGVTVDTIKKYDAIAASKSRQVAFVVGLPDDDTIAKFKALPEPHVPCLVELELSQVIESGCKVWGPRWTRGTMASDVASAKSQGIFTAFWTINEPEFLDRFLLEGKPNAILTDREGLLFHRYQMLAKQGRELP